MTPQERANQLRLLTVEMSQLHASIVFMALMRKLGVKLK